MSESYSTRFCARYDDCEYVSLTDEEYRTAISRGEDTYRHSQSRGMKDYRSFVRDGVDGCRVQCLGSIAEFAAAKLLGVRLSGWMNTFKGSDLSGNIEVRLIGAEHYGLRVYDRDRDSRRVIGVVIPKGREREPYRIPGWIPAGIAKIEEYRMDPLNRGHPFFCVPQSRLIPVSTLAGLLKSENNR